MLHLAIKAFAPGRLPFPVMHVDTGHNFDEVISTRDRLVAEHGVRLVVASVQDDIDAGRVVDNGPSRNPLQTVTLLRGIRENKFDAAFGGARRDEEKARAKERVFSFRDEFGQWDPKAQRPELWNLYNGRHHKGEHIRVFPLSNWTEYDIWAYIGAENITLPAIYYAHRRPVFQRDGMLLAVHEFLQPERRRGGVRDLGAIPHRRRRHLHRLRGIRRRDGRRGDRRDRGVTTDRARRDPRRRPDLRGRHGRPQAGGLLLMTTLLRLATAGSVDDGKSTLIGRLLYDSKAVMEDQLASVEKTSARTRPRLHRPRVGDRRPALRTRAGHHHRRRVPLLRHAQAKIHHRRHTGSHPVHPQHGDRYVDGAAGDRARRRPPRTAGAVPPTRFPGVAAGRAAHRARRQQDGPGRLGQSAIRGDPRRVPRLRRTAGRARRHHHPDVGAASATTS